MTDIIVKLSKPLITHNGEHTELNLRTPTVRSFRQYGDPVRMYVTKEGSTKFDYDNAAVVGFLADCTGVDETLLDTLPAPDFFRLRTALEQIIFGLTGTGARTGDSPLEQSAA